jgi:hypothetical protein
MRIGMGWLGLGQVTLGFPEVTGSTSTSGNVDTSTGISLAFPEVSPAAAIPTCPTGSTCSIVPGIPDTNIYLAVGLVAAGFLFMGMHK